MTKAQDAAQWMWAELQRTGTLSQPHAARHVALWFGKELVHVNSRGTVAMSHAMLHQFRLLHRGRAQWHPSPDNCWRLVPS